MTGGPTTMKSTASVAVVGKPESGAAGVDGDRCTDDSAVHGKEKNTEAPTRRPRWGGGVGAIAERHA